MFKRKKDGSPGFVCVFLAIVMVPCITFTCLFADLSRVQLSAALAESSADLALNNTLVNYDQELEQYYGLIASCQDMDEYYTTTSQFFTAMLKSQGLSDEETALFDSYLKDIIAQYQGVDAVSFLATDIEGDVTVEAVGDGLGDSAALIQDQIVEFMKYRGPIEITTGLVARLSSMTVGDQTIVEQITEASEDEPVQEAKQEYAETQGELLEAMYNTYMAIKTYEDAQIAGSSPTYSGYTDMQEDLKNIWTDYASMTELIVQYYANSSGLTAAVAPSASLNSSAKSKEDVGTRVEIPQPTAEPDEDADPEATPAPTPEPEIKYYMKESTVSSKLSTIDSSIETITTNAQAAYEAFSAIESPEGNTTVNPVQYCLKLQELNAAGNYISKIASAASDLVSAYEYICASANCDDNPNSSTDDTLRASIATAKAKAESTVSTYLSGSGNNNFRSIVVYYATLSAEVKTEVDNQSYTFESLYLDDNVTVATFVSAVSSYLTTQKTYYQDRIDELEVAINGSSWSFLSGSNGVKSLEALEDLAVKFQTDRDAWGDAAEDAGTTYGEEERALYDGEDENSAESEKAAAAVTDTSVKELKDRLENIQTEMQNLCDAIDAFTYNGTKIANISSASTAIQKAKNGITTSSIGLYFSENETYAENIAASLISPAQTAIYTPASQVESNDPVLTNNTPSLYQYMKDQFGGSEDDIASEKSSNDSRNDAYASAAQDAQDDANEPNTVSNNQIVDDYDTDAVNAISALSGTLTVMTCLLDLNFSAIRDNIYVAEYVMDMFSYSSYESEGKYNLLQVEHNGEYNGEPITLSNQEAAYESVKADWEEEDVTKITTNKTLTNIMINTTNNAAYAAEVEYVLYGGQGVTNRQTIIRAYADIFALRLAANTLSGFKLYYTVDQDSSLTALMIESIASAIVVATSGVVPVALTKSILIVTLATMESANDLNRLKNGIPVSLIKLEEDDWFFNISVDANDDSGGKNASFGGVEQPVDENGLFYSDYLYLFLLVNLGSEATANDMLLRIGEIIETNMRFHPDGDEDYDLASAYQYFQLSAKLKVDPLMIDLPIIEQTTSWEEFKESDTWCTYEISVIRGYS
ncbi:MAG: DUF5702 domain-containing protein [Faecalibacterium sp.]